MDIYSYLNSKDVADYCRSLDYKFDAIEAAFIVNACRRISQEEKLRLFQEIIDTMPDGEAVARYQRAGAEIVVLDPGLDECVRRARKDKRRKGTESAIMKWYDAKHEGKLGAISGNASPQSREW